MVVYRVDTVSNDFGINGPQAEFDSKAAYVLNQIPRERVEDPNIAELARLLIRYNYPSELVEIVDQWGMTINSLMASATNYWQLFERLNAEASNDGSNWDVSPEEL